ncbi:hypothetical protein D9M70_602850 [compost metagenome]
MTVVNRTGTPDSSAARALPPLAYTQRPKAVRLSSTAATTATMASTSTPTGMPRTWSKPSQLKPVLPNSGRPPRLLKVNPLVISSATPRATYSTPSVATKAGTLKKAISTPLTAPTKAPSAQVSRTTTQTGG